MTINAAQVGRNLQDGDFRRLFIEELGWDKHSAQLPLQVDGQRFTLQAIGEKRGVVVLVCPSPGAGPDYAMRRKIERQVAQRHREHLIIYANDDRSQQIWQWVRQEPGKPLAAREHRYYNQQSGESLIQKLAGLAFSLEEEEQLTLIDVTGRVRAAFDVAKVTKKFYDQFNKERTAFQKFLTGLPAAELQGWYVSVMLNRLMFILFIQKKGFLNNDLDYLRTKLFESRQRGADRYYRDFLCPLFFEGFAKPPATRSGAVNKLLGRVPYLDGGIFQRHQLEQAHGQDIRIPDAAFARLFDFFEQYQWHLDDRLLRDDREINPGVLGYIFEKYINQKQMGAYYTEEDITGYISKHTIIPFLFDAAAKIYPAAFKTPGLSGDSVWSLLPADPDRYIYPAVRKGAELPLPQEIAAGVDDVGQRGAWNQRTPDAYALPTEIWRETVTRRLRYAEVRAKLAQGEIQAINDLITYNLDIRQFAQDVIESCSDPQLLRAFWSAIRAITVLDPTCGSGAFLFAALNILEPLYEACLERMEAFLGELGPHDSAQKYRDFRDVLAEVDQHPNRPYYIYKSIIVNNLYGVDIMHEAVEIAKLRLFLKLVAQVERVDDIEPLPDIDFNIRAGQYAGGLYPRAEVERAVRGDRLLLLPEDEESLQRIEEQANAVDRLFEKFKQLQTTHDLRAFGDDYAVTKQALDRRLALLEDELSRLLARQYGVDPDKENYAKWLETHQPFHWFVEFFGIINRGGFDVIIGNPPWKEYSAIKKFYQVLNYEALQGGNLYGLCTERALNLRGTPGWLSFIVQLPLTNSSRMESLRQLIRGKSNALYIASFDDRPGKLFTGLQNCRSAIFVSAALIEMRFDKLLTTRYRRWQTDFRNHLFSLVHYVGIDSSRLIYPDQFPKYASPVQQTIFEKVAVIANSTMGATLATRKTESFIFYQEATRYWVKAVVGLPHYAKNGAMGAPAHGRYLYFDNADSAYAICAALNSSLFYAYFISYGQTSTIAAELISGFAAI